MGTMFYVWLLLALLGIASEVMLGVVGWGLVLGLGATVGVVLAALDFSLAVQLLGVALVTLLAAPLIVRQMRRFNDQSAAASTLLSEGARRGEEFTVVQAGERLGVRIEGDFYPARSAAGELHVGQRVRLLGMSGITAQVEPVETVDQV